MGLIDPLLSDSLILQELYADNKNKIIFKHEDERNIHEKKEKDEKLREDCV